MCTGRIPKLFWYVFGTLAFKMFDSKENQSFTVLAGLEKPLKVYPDPPPGSKLSNSQKVHGIEFPKNSFSNVRQTASAALTVLKSVTIGRSESAGRAIVSTSSGCMRTCALSWRSLRAARRCVCESAGGSSGGASRHVCCCPQTSSTLSRGLGRRIHGSVEDTKLSTNKQHSLSARA